MYYNINVAGTKPTNLITFNGNSNYLALVEHEYIGFENVGTYMQQYYTNEKLSKLAYEIMTESYSEKELESFSYLEPSCGGIGGLIECLPKNKTTGVDISKINISLRKEQGFNVINEDFINYGVKTKDRYNMIIMNPPFRNNQAYNHTVLASRLLKENGVLTSIIPSCNKDFFSELDTDFEITYSKEFGKEFDETNIKVVIVKLKKK